MNSPVYSGSNTTVGVGPKYKARDETVYLAFSLNSANLILAKA